MLNRIRSQRQYALAVGALGRLPAVFESECSRTCQFDPWQSYNFTDRYIRHSNYVLRLDPVSTATDRADATFRITS